MNFENREYDVKFGELISSAFDSGRLPHAIILEGANENTRLTFAQTLAKALVCTESEKALRPCGKCQNCMKAESQSHVDIKKVEGTNKSKTVSVEDIRKVRSDAYIVPNEAERKVYIITAAHRMNETAMNAFLKILEEPPATARFILASRSRDDFRQTILSRVTAFAISEDSGQAAGEKENSKASKAAEDILTALITKNEAKLMLSTGSLEKDKKNYKAALEKMILMLRNSIVSKYRADCDMNITEKKFADIFSEKEIINMQSVLKNLLSDTDKNANDNLLVTRLTIELMSCIDR